MPSHLRLIAQAGSEDELSAILCPYVIRQKLGHVHNNPVEAGTVLLAEHYRLSSAASYDDDFMEKWLQNFAYRIAIQWTVFALAGVVAVAFLTISFQSVKAALANPVKSLRSE